jgi:hypothetical protein
MNHQTLTRAQIPMRNLVFIMHFHGHDCVNVVSSVNLESVTILFCQGNCENVGQL